MKTTTQRNPHPMLLAAGIAIILFCGVAIAAVMGWIPSSIGRTVDPTEIAAVEKAKAVPEKPRRVASSSAALTSPIRVACAHCGVISSIRTIQTAGEGSGVGAVGGAVVGGLLGNQVGGGSGKDAMTVVGAIGGAFAGNHIEKNVKTTTSYEIGVRMDDGSDRVFHESGQPSWRQGDKVKIINGSLRSA